MVEVQNLEGSSSFVLICEHASKFIPAEFKGLGLESEARVSHVAWDPGALAVAQHMSWLLDAPLIAQEVSRLVYDCNRPPHDPTAMPEKSEIYQIPGNATLSEAQRAERVTRFYEPFRHRLASLICERGECEKPPVLLTIHSYTPIYNGKSRAVEVGILHDDDTRLADALLSCLQGCSFNVQRNAPYGPEDGVTHTLKEHGLKNGLLNVMVELRNDLIATPEQQGQMAELLSKALHKALPMCE
ncbi:N-formylglutamate amidohydrolase [Flexibacterium corallicola]|uniref:N-formylglutamate amidohydrolase n=1 Tax=Flexibacterium corallicola TaxID=3037259 RepID=UPI00286EE726|nr:N-formylglutamate amidohydrolase [Pseudovibrio sp. M1P-2-3]